MKHTLGNLGNKKKSSVDGPKRKIDIAKKQVSEKKKKQVSEPIYWTHQRNAEQKDRERECMKRGKKDKPQVLPALWQEV